jgi:ferrous iron transport protein B
LRSTLIRGAPTPFIMELPPYRLPTLYGIITHTWDRVWQFVKKAGTVIFAISIVMWVLITFPQLSKEQVENFNIQRENVTQQAKNIAEDDDRQTMLTNKLINIDNIEQETALKHSYGGRMGVWLESISKYAGFPWQANIALIGGFAAKEVILSTLSTAYSLGSSEEEVTVSSSSKNESHGELTPKTHESMLAKRLSTSRDWTMPAVISFLLFILLYAPCFVTVVAMAKESSWGWALFGTFGSLVFTYILCVIVYQVCSVFL